MERKGWKLWFGCSAFVWSLQVTSKVNLGKRYSPLHIIEGDMHGPQILQTSSVIFVPSAWWVVDRKRGLMSHQNWWQLQHSQLMAGGNKILANSIDVDAVLFFWEPGKFFRGARRKMRKTRAKCSTKRRCAGLTWSMIGMPWPLSQVLVVPPRVSGLFRNVFFKCLFLSRYDNILQCCCSCQLWNSWSRDWCFVNMTKTYYQDCQMFVQNSFILYW